MSTETANNEHSGALDCSTLYGFESLPSNDERRRFLESVQKDSTVEHVGRKVVFGGYEWEITGINYLGFYLS